jgi:hypothetical protein
VVAGITFAAPTADDDTVWVRPDHSLTVRQSVAPLERPLEIIGQAVPAAGEELLHVLDAGFVSGPEVEWQLADDWFAPAQFEELGRIEKLSRASFERMPAGVTFGAPGAAIPEGEGMTTSVTTDYEEETWRPEPAADPLAHSVRSGAAGVGLRHLDARAVTPRFTIAPTAYTVVRVGDGSTAVDALRDAGVARGGVSQYDARRARRQAIARDEGNAARLVVVPASAALEAGT